MSLHLTASESYDVGTSGLMKTGNSTAVVQALTHISSEDACAFFIHCGFRFRPELAQWSCP
jgi:hypothetical protein